MSHHTEPEKDLGTQGSEDSLKGKLNQAAGTVKKHVGHAVGNHELEAKGAAQQVGGKLQDKGGQLEQKVDHKLDQAAANNDPRYTTEP